MSKQVILGKASRDKLVEGIDILADAVVATLGPNGRNVVIDKNLEEPISTKDGITVAKSIELEDPTQNLGAKLVKQAAIKTHEKAGDGTTTSILLAREMIKGGLKHLNNGENAVDISNDIKKTVKRIINILKEDFSENVKNEKQLMQIATISSNNDPEIGKYIAESIRDVELDGIVYIEESKTGDTYLESVEGLQFDRGYTSPYFVTNNDTMTSVLENPKILLIDGKLIRVKEILPILNKISTEGESLLIIAEDVAQEALATLLVNKGSGVLKVCAVKSPDFGDRRKLVLEDIAILTGGVVYSPDKSMKLDNFSNEWFGKARTVTVTKEQTTIIDGEGNEEAIEKRIIELQTQIKMSDSPFEIEKLQERLAKFKGGVVIIHVGGNTEIEMREKKDRVDDSLNATKAAIEEGIIPGGGVALLYAREKLNPKTIGEQIVYDACEKPFIQILVNAGISPERAFVIAEKDLVGSKSKKLRGYDIRNNKIVDMKKAGIIDPTKVTREALENAASVAGIVLLTECSVVDLPGEKKHNPMDGVDISKFGY